MIVLGVDGSPRGAGKTACVIRAVLDGAADRGANVNLIRHDAADIVSRIADSDAVVFGSPTYRASHSAAMRVLLEAIDREGAEAPLLATPALVVMTGGSPSHFLGTEDLASTLRVFFGIQVLSPSLYFDPQHFDDDGRTTEETAERCRTHGAALWELAAAVRNSVALRALRPLA